MNRLLTRVTAAAGSLALAGTVVVLAAAPAAATPSGGSSSYGASAPAGLTTASPQGLALSTGPALVFQPNVNIAGLLTTGLTLDTASTVAAYSRVTSVNAQMSGSGHGDAEQPDLGHRRRRRGPGRPHPLHRHQPGPGPVHRGDGLQRQLVLEHDLGHQPW